LALLKRLREIPAWSNLLKQYRALEIKSMQHDTLDHLIYGYAAEFGFSDIDLVSKAMEKLHS